MDLIASWPMSTPASSVPTIFPSLNVPNRTRPSRNPSASVKKTASSGFCLSAATTLAITPSSELTDCTVAQFVAVTAVCLLYGHPHVCAQNADCSTDSAFASDNKQSSHPEISIV